jgi:hypothetical protein
LVDVSASVDFRTLELPRNLSGEVESGLLAHLGPQDRLDVGAFGATVKFGGFVLADRPAWEATVRAVCKDRSVGLNGPSRIWDAVDEAMSRLEGQPGRRAVIVMTDGHATGNRVSLNAVIDHARAAHASVYVIGSGWLPSRGLPDPGPIVSLRNLATETGGMLVSDDVGDSFRPRHPAHLLETLLRALRSSQ